MFEKVTENVYAITDGSTVGNVGLIALESGKFLIDTSMYPKVAREIRQSLETIRGGQLLGGVFTHYHFDHTGGSQVFHDVPMYGHQLALQNFEKNYMTEEFLDRVRKQDEQFLDLEPTPPSRVFSTNPFVPEEIDNVEIIHTGGHTSGSVLIHLKTDNVIFAGDNLFVGRFPWGGDPTASPYDWKSAMERILEIRPEWVIPGHGSPVDTLEVIKTYHEYMGKIIDLGEKLRNEGIPEDKAMEEVMEIDFLPEAREGMKAGTLQRWISVIYQRT